MLGVDSTNKSVKVSMELLKGNSGADAFTVWQRQPGNENKTFEDYMAAIKGDKGNDGNDGKSFSIIGLYPTLDDLETSVPDGSGIDGVYGVGIEAPYTYYAWVDVDGIGKWASQGQLQGGDGKSAYEIAVENGFRGTEAEWLATLKGKDAPELKPATASTLGGIKVGNNLTMRADGTLDAKSGSGTGDGVLTLPYVAPERDSDGNITNSAAFVDAWGGILTEYLAAPDSHALYMEIDAGEGIMLRMPCNLMNMGGEADAVQWLISGFTVVNAPLSPTDPVPCKATCMANVVCNAAGEMQSLVMYASEGIVGADGQPNLLGADDAVIVAIPNDATEEQLKAIMQPVLAALQINPKRRVVIQYGFLLIPATTAITDAEFLIAALDANPLTVSDPDSKWVVKVQVYCKLSNGVIQSATGGVTAYELATTEAMTAALKGKANVNGDETKAFAAKFVQAEYLNATEPGSANHMYIGRGDKISSAYAATEVAIQNNSPSGTIRLACAADPVYTTIANPGVRHKLWHSGNFDPATVMKTGDTISEAAIYEDAAARLGNSVCAVARMGQNALLVSFSAPASASPLQLYVPLYSGASLMWRNGVDNNVFMEPGFKTIYDSSNLGPATAASAGLMSAEDKIKLNSVASAMSLTVQTADTPATLSLTDEAIPETVVTPEISVRAQRAAQYQMQADELLYDALEAFARNHPEHSEFAAWLEAKDRIRKELPKPEEGGGNE